jgi:ABC-2 type transport system ATP-binding protein
LLQTKLPLIQISNLTKIYNGKEVVSNLNLEIPPSCFALLGPNGAGKTTVLLMLLGLIFRTTGRVRILGKEIPKELNSIRNEIGYLPENVGFFPHLTGIEHVKFFQRLKLGGLTAGDKDPETILQWCGLEEEKWDAKVKTYSRGMRQRLGLALAFVGNPTVVILDEPLSNIDPLGRDDLIKKIRLERENGINVIISSHIIQEVEQIADNIAFIDKGRLLSSGSFIKLAIDHQYHDFEIKSKLNKDDDANKILEFLKSNKKHLLSEPITLEDRIVFKSREVEKIVRELTSKNKPWAIKPIDGTLIKIYKEYMQR